MTIKTRIAEISRYDVPMSWFEKWDGISPATRLYITTDKPASEMSIIELLELIEDKKAEATIAKALAQYHEAIDILKSFGAEIETQVVGLEQNEWLKNRPCFSHLFKEGEL
jgi:hypothetical protein